MDSKDLTRTLDALTPDAGASAPNKASKKRIPHSGFEQQLAAYYPYPSVQSDARSTTLSDQRRATATDRSGQRKRRGTGDEDAAE